MPIETTPDPIPFRSEEPTQSEVLFSSNPDVIMESARPVLGEYVDRLGDHTGLDGAGRTALLRDFATALDDAKIPSDEGVQMIAHIVSGAISKPDDATVTEWAAETRKYLREHYKEADATRRLAIVKQYVAQRPTLAKLLTDSGAGSHPAIVTRLVEQAHQLRVTPMPKRKAK